MPNKPPKDGGDLDFAKCAEIAMLICPPSIAALAFVGITFSWLEMSFLDALPETRILYGILLFAIVISFILLIKKSRVGIKWCAGTKLGRLLMSVVVFALCVWVMFSAVPTAIRKERARRSAEETMAKELATKSDVLLTPYRWLPSTNAGFPGKLSIMFLADCQNRGKPTKVKLTDIRFLLNNGEVQTGDLVLLGTKNKFGQDGQFVSITDASGLLYQLQNLLHTGDSINGHLSVVVSLKAGTVFDREAERILKARLVIAYMDSYGKTNVSETDLSKGPREDLLNYPSTAAFEIQKYLDGEQK